VRSREVFSVEAGSERIEEFRPEETRIQGQWEEEEESAIHKLTTFNLGKFTISAADPVRFWTGSGSDLSTQSRPDPDST
jgi:hypothetical protein